MLVYIAFRFEWVYGAAAFWASFMTSLITLGFFSLLHFEISLTVIAACSRWSLFHERHDRSSSIASVRITAYCARNRLLTWSTSPSIRLFRERSDQRPDFPTVLVLFLMGGQVLRAFSFALVVGIVVGTYSSFGIAAPLVVAWNRWRAKAWRQAPDPQPATKPAEAKNVPGRLAPAGRR